MTKLKEKKTSKIWLWLILFVGFLGVGVYAYYWYQELPYEIGRSLVANDFLNLFS